MDVWEERQASGEAFVPGEFTVCVQDGVRIDEADDKKTAYRNGELLLTSHRLVWSSPRTSTTAVVRGLGRDLVLQLRHIILVENETSGSFVATEKLVLHLRDPRMNSSGPLMKMVKLVFKQGGCRKFQGKLTEALTLEQWKIKVLQRPARTGARVMRSGIGGIERSLEQKSKETHSEISRAFQDLDKLMQMAKPMVKLAKTISSRIREKQGDVNDDETVKFKSYLMSLGISDPVTRDTHGTGQAYFLQLAKEVCRILEQPLTEIGGMMTLTDAYCRVNRARGMELVSPEDLVNACRLLATNPGLQGLPVRMVTFESTGVSVLQLNSVDVNSQQMLTRTRDVVQEQPAGLTAEQLARVAGIAVVLATERLLATEKSGLICRDNSVEGLRFFPNLFLFPASSGS